MVAKLMISVVEDDAFVRLATENLLVSLGFDVLAFASAQAFIESGRVGDASCLITDIRMPGLSGLDLQAHLNAKGQRLPIIFMTAFPSDETQEKALKGGAVGFLKKPFTDECLIRCLDKALGREGGRI